MEPFVLCLVLTDSVQAVKTHFCYESDCQHTEDARSLMSDLQLGTLFLLLKKNDTLSLSTFRRQLKYFYFSLY